MRLGDFFRVGLLAALAFVGLMLIVNSPASAHVAVKDDHLRAVVQELRAEMKADLNSGQWRAAKRLWDAESHWNPRSGDPDGCFGIPQACPGSKMKSAIRPHAGARWDSIRDPFVQGAWGTDYVRVRYGTFKKALRFQDEHGWY